MWGGYGCDWGRGGQKQTELIILHGGVEDWSFPTLARGDIHTLYMLNNMVLNASRCKVHDMG